MKTLKVLGLLAALTFGTFTAAHAGEGEGCSKPDTACCTKGGDCCKK